MRISINASGAHEDATLGRCCYMVVDNHGVLVDLKGLPGPLSNPDVLGIEWGMISDEGQEYGYLTRSSGTAAAPAVRAEKISGIEVLQPYIAAYNARMAQVGGDDNG